MLHVAFEVPSDDPPRRILTECWGWLQRGFPGECGGLTEAPSPQGGGLVQIVMGVPRWPRAYELLLDALTAVDVWAREQWAFPALYDSAVRYVPEPRGFEVWASTPALFMRGAGDCEDLACDRAAELVTQGLPAHAVLRSQGNSGGGEQWHVLVGRSDGSIEDPSAHLGME